MFVLDTDSLSLFLRGHPDLTKRVRQTPPEELAITVLTVEEQVKGWLTLLNRRTDPAEMAEVYQRLTDTVRVLSRLHILSFTEPAIRRWHGLRAMRLNVGKMDERIAAVVLEVEAVLVTRNTRDFARVPGLVLQDWSAPAT